MTADWHLRNYVQGRCREMTGDAAHGLDQIAESCEKNRPAAVLALGDLCDSTTPDSRSVRDLYRFMDRMRAAGVRVLFVQGQHEFAPPGSTWLGVHPWPEHIHRGLVEVDGLRIYGLDYCPRGSLAAALAEVPPDADVLATHQVWRDFVGSGELSLSDVPHVRAVLTGDYHRHLAKTVTGASGQELLVLSPGSTCMQSWGEDAEKKFFVVGRAEHGGLTRQSVSLTTRPFHDMYVGTPAAVAGAVRTAAGIVPNELLPEEVRKPAVRIRYSRDIPGAYEELTAAYAGVHLFLEDVPRREADVPEGPADDAAALDDLLRADLAARGADELFDAACRLRDAADPAREWAELEPTLAGD